MKFVRFFHPEDGARCGVLLDDRVHDISDTISSLAKWLQQSATDTDKAIADLKNAAQNATTQYPAAIFNNAPSHDQAHWLSPLDSQNVWASGVTYERSREARQEESVDGGDIYARVYSAERPEIFFKAQADQTVGMFDHVGIRSDATWSVPEPELGLLINPALQVVGYTIGNDMSSRDIEGENPLYLPQAKMYTASCAIGPAIVIQPLTEWVPTTIEITIQRDGNTMFFGNIHTDRIHRKMNELVDYLGRCMQFPNGVLLLTGTGVVPPNEFTLHADDVISITIDGVGTLTNAVKVV